MAAPDGRRAAAEFIVEGDYLATDEGLPEARGQAYRLPAGAFYAIRDGRIARVTMHYNLTDWLGQVHAPGRDDGHAGEHHDTAGQYLPGRHLAEPGRGNQRGENRLHVAHHRRIRRLGPRRQAKEQGQRDGGREDGEQDAQQPDLVGCTNATGPSTINASPPETMPDTACWPRASGAAGPRGALRSQMVLIA